MNRIYSTLRSEPYRALFPIGYFFLVFGLGIWSVNLLGQSPELARIHAVFMANGFLFAFSAGILITELPALLRIPPMRPMQLSLLLACLIAMGAAALAQNVFYAHLFHFLSMINVTLYLVLGLLGSGVKGQPGPLLVLCGCLLSLAGTALFLLAEAFSIPREFGSWGAYAGFLGYAFLFSTACLHWSREQEDHGENRSDFRWLWAALAFMLASLALEAISFYSANPDPLMRGAYVVRAVWLAWFIRRPKNVFSIMEGMPIHGFLVRIGLFFALAGSVLSAFNPGRTVVFNHVTFLAGFAWIALSAGTGVIAARMKSGNRKTGITTLVLGGLSLIIGVALRVSAAFPDFAGSSRTALLGFAAAFALAPVFVWAVAFFPSLADPDDRKDPDEVSHKLRRVS
jgi:hypothetical protein